MIKAIFIFFLLLLHIEINEHPEKRREYKEPPPQKILPGAEPFYYKGEEKKAVLLLHGFEDSPFSLRALGKYLHKKGYTVSCPLLPGHGTSVKDLLQSRYYHWQDKAEKEYRKLKEKFEEVFIVGFSMGALLALGIALEYTKHPSLRPKGIFLIAPPIFIQGFINGKWVYRDWRLFFTGIIQYILPLFPKGKVEKESFLLSPWIGYSEAYIVPALHSLRRFMAKIRKKLSTTSIEIPVGIIHAEEDKTVPIESTYYLLRKLRSPLKEVYVFSLKEKFTTAHILTNHPYVKKKLFTWIEEFFHEESFPIRSS